METKVHKTINYKNILSEQKKNNFVKNKNINYFGLK